MNLQKNYSLKKCSPLLRKNDALHSYLNLQMIQAKQRNKKLPPSSEEMTAKLWSLVTWVQWSNQTFLRCFLGHCDFESFLLDVNKNNIQGNFGSFIAYSGLHVNPIVKANLIPLSTFSTRCGFSAPDVNADARPAIGSIFCSTSMPPSGLGSNINRPPS